MWLRAMWWVTNPKAGINAIALQRALGLGSYQTAWAWLHKLRRAMVRPARDRLSGRVEVDETYVGGEEQGVQGRETYKKAIVAISIEVHDPKGYGRLRLHHVSGVTAADLTPFVCDAITPGSTVLTDGWAGYDRIEKHGYVRQRIALSSRPDPAHVAMPGVHRIASLLKRWLLGTHQGAVSNKHLAYYLDEFTFRFNRRACRSRGKLFYRLAQQALLVDSVPYRRLVDGASNTAPQQVGRT
jgi:transposase-like protein